MVISDKTAIRGKMTARVFRFPEGRGKQLLAMRDDLVASGDIERLVAFDDKYVVRRKRTVLERLRGLPGKQMVSVNHNIVTNHGDALIADLMAETPAQTKVNNTNGKIGVGTGFSSAAKTVTALVTQTGSDEVLDATYPKLKGAFNAADDNVTQYRSTFEAGDLSATGIDEAALGNGTYLLAYAEVTPNVNMTVADTLQVDWELTFVGA